MAAAVTVPIALLDGAADWVQLRRRLAARARSDCIWAVEGLPDRPERYRPVGLWVLRAGLGG